MPRGLVRFGLAMEEELLTQLDALAAARACTRSELIRDLARTAVTRAGAKDAAPAVASVTLVYNHHVRLLSEKLTAIQHDLGPKVQAAMHVHLDHENCLEVVILRGPAGELRDAADRMLSTRGVHHGGIELVTEKSVAASSTHRHQGAPHAHPQSSQAGPRARTKAKAKATPAPPRKRQRTADTVHSPSPRK